MMGVCGLIIVIGMINFLNISVLIVAVLFGAVADGFNERGWKDAGHWLEPMEKPVLILGGALMGWMALIPYIAFRVSLFDPVKNLARGQKWNYVGEVGWWDGLLSKIPPHGVVFIRVIFLVFAVGFTIREW